MDKTTLEAAVKVSSEIDKLNHEIASLSTAIDEKKDLALETHIFSIEDVPCQKTITLNLEEMTMLREHKIRRKVDLEEKLKHM